MDPEGDESGESCYYSVLGISKSASSSEIRSAYRKLALKWHPDRWTRDPSVSGEAKLRFQKIQEAYSVLSDDGKRAMYDLGLYDPFEEEDEGFSDFMQEMLSMMDCVKTEKEDSIEDLQRMLDEMVRGEGPEFGAHGNVIRGPSDASKGTRVRAAPEGGSTKRCRSKLSRFGDGIFC